MLQVPIYWNPFTMLNTVYALANVIPLLIIAFIVYHRDPTSKINRLFSLGSALFALAYALFPIGGLFWNVSILSVQVILISTRLVFFIGFISQVVLCWVALALYEGEAMWSRRRTVFFAGSLILINLVGVLTPDAIYIINGPPEIDTGEGLIYSLLGYPLIALLITVSLVTFSKTYFEFHKEDRIIGRQAMVLTIGTSLEFTAMLTGLLSLLLLMHSLTFLVFAVASTATVVKSFGFTQEASLVKLKVTSELRRMKIAISKGQIERAELQLKFIKDLVAREKSIVANARMLTLEGLVKTYQADIPSARLAFNDAKELAENEHLTGLLNEIDDHIEHLQVYETMLTISESVTIPHNYTNEAEEIERALAYLDEITKSPDIIFERT
ncbi:MAG: hypothetical protein JW779_12295 [Candidatus Thorarchaeota archaeon]|nr:hypothetical protein [Candidatus Thorarchaeota archaeon]